jgi:superfamily II DNA or RNA helicase
MVKMKLPDPLVAVIDSRIWLPPGLPRPFENAVKNRFTHKNPDFFRARNMGFATWGIDSKISTWEMRTDRLGERLTIPRGGTRALRELCESFGIRLKWLDRRTIAPTDFPFFKVHPDRPYELRDYQAEGVAVSLEKQQGIVRSPTGSGKTTSALALIFEAQERALVIMRDRNLLKQWRADVKSSLGLTNKEIGHIMSGRKYFPGRKIVLALQQTLFARIDECLEIFRDDPFGIVVIDEVQLLAAKTFITVVDAIPAKMRIGFSADERRKDGKEFLIYDYMGEVIHETERKKLESLQVIHPVTIRVVESDFRADWYRDAEANERDFGKLLEEMTDNHQRNFLILETIRGMFLAGEVPVLVFTSRREHAHELAVDYLTPNGLETGILIGGTGKDAERFELDKAALLSEKLHVGIGTFQAIGVGHNIPVLRAGLCSTPVSKHNPQFFGQVRGRFCRTSKATGKTEAFLYYIWDREIFPDHLRFLERHNRGRVQLFRGGEWISLSSVR